MKGPENNIENFFNSRLSDAEFPFQENDWDNMEKRLDLFDRLAEQPAIPVKRQLLWLVPFAILLFFMGWFSRDYIIGSKSLTDPIKNPIDIKTPIKPETEEGTINKNPISSNTTEINQAKANERTSVLNLNSDQSTDNGYTYATVKQLNTTGNSNNPIRTFSDEIHFSDRRVMTGKNLEFDIPLTTHVIQHLSIAEDPEEEKEVIQKSSWSAALIISPDFNGVGGWNNYKATIQVGALGYYRFSENWRVSTGLLYASKKYTSSGGDYHPPENYWKYVSGGVVPEEIMAVCNMIDVPINLTYLWRPTSKLTLTSTFGFSNYFILTEEYEYSFTDENPEYPYGWHTEQNSSAFLALLNFGLGLEWRISRDIHLGAEPYYKLPITDIGWGNVRLNGTGIFFSIRKSFNKK